MATNSIERTTIPYTDCSSNCSTENQSIAASWIPALRVTHQRPLLPFPDMHARPMVDPSLPDEEDEIPESVSRVPNIGDIDMLTLNRLLYEVGSRRNESHVTMLGNFVGSALRRALYLCLPVESPMLFWYQPELPTA